MKEIDKLAWLCIKDQQLLLARSQGKNTYYIPGGKREAGESDSQALIREINEELSINLLPKTIKYVGTFKAQAHEKPEGMMVKISCYQADFTGEIQASAEIAEVIWCHDETQVNCSPVTLLVMEYLRSKSLIKSIN